MISEVAELPDIILVEGDNCTAQYKSAENFHDPQMISDKNDRKIIRGILQKLLLEGKLHLVCTYKGLQKWFISCKKYSDRSNPTYYFKEIDCKQLDIACASSRLQKIPNHRWECKISSGCL